MCEPLTVEWFQDIADRYFDLNYTCKQLKPMHEKLLALWHKTTNSGAECNTHYKLTRIKLHLLGSHISPRKPTARPEQVQHYHCWLEGDGKVLYRVGMTGIQAGSNALGPGGEGAFRKWEDDLRFIESEALNTHKQEAKS